MNGILYHKGECNTQNFIGFESIQDDGTAHLNEREQMYSCEANVPGKHIVWLMFLWHEK